MNYLRKIEKELVNKLANLPSDAPRNEAIAEAYKLQKRLDRVMLQIKYKEEGLNRSGKPKKRGRTIVDISPPSQDPRRSNRGWKEE